MSDTDRFDVFQDKRGRWRWRRFNGSEVVGASTEGYAARAECEANMNRGPNPTDKWDFYIDRRGLYRWRRLALNGRLIGAASRGFDGRAAAEANARRQGFEG
ncbi:MAG: hypothetical protein AAGI34_17860 [Pseudomonadota bacterium]